MKPRQGPDKPDDAFQADKLVTSASQIPGPMTAPPDLVPVTEEDVRREKIRRWTKWGIAVAILAAASAIAINLTKAPTDARVAYDQGDRLFRAGRYREAVIAFENAVAARGNFIDAYFMRGTSYFVLGQTQRALQDFTRVIKLDPTQVRAYYYRAVVYRAVGDRQHAVVDLAKAIEFDASASYAYNLRGQCYREIGDTTRAMADLNKAVSLDDNLDNHMQRGYLFAQLGQHNEAIADFSRGMELMPDSPMTYMARATSRLAIGDEAGARADRDMAKTIEHRQ